MRLIITCLLAVFCGSAGLSQNKGLPKVTKADVMMSQFEADTTASAIILHDIGRFNGNTHNFTRNLRIKILKKSGLGWGNLVFNTPSKSSFKVVVYNLNEGELVQESAGAKTTYKEDVVNSFQVYKVFAPDVRVGSVIDVEYSFLGLPFEWRFQDIVPVLRSELTLEPSAYVEYRKTHFGFQPIETLSDISWRAVNMPAFQEEPFMNSYTNYLTKFEFQVISFGSGRYFLDIGTTWKKVNEILLIIPGFGDKLKNMNFLDAKAEEIEKSNASVQEKVAHRLFSISSPASHGMKQKAFSLESPFAILLKKLTVATLRISIWR